MFTLLLVQLGNSLWFHTYVAFSLFMLGHTIVCTWAPGAPYLTLEFYVYVLQFFVQSACQNLSFNSLSIRVCLLSVIKTVKNFLALPICQLHAIQLLYQYSTDSAVQLLLLVRISKEGCNTPTRIFPGVCKQWTGLLEWIIGLDYWTNL